MGGRGGVAGGGGKGDDIENSGASMRGRRGGTDKERRKENRSKTLEAVEGKTTDAGECKKKRNSPGAVGGETKKSKMFQEIVRP